MRTPQWTSLGLVVSMFAFVFGTQLGQPLAHGVVPIDANPSGAIASSDEEPAPQQASCGDGRCQPPEDCNTCPSDCGSCCGDGRCQPPEDCNSCPADCSC